VYLSAICAEAKVVINILSIPRWPFVHTLSYITVLIYLYRAAPHHITSFCSVPFESKHALPLLKVPEKTHLSLMPCSLSMVLLNFRHRTYAFFAVHIHQGHPNVSAFVEHLHKLYPYNSFLNGERPRLLKIANNPTYMPSPVNLATNNIFDLFYIFLPQGGLRGQSGRNFRAN